MFLFVIKNPPSSPNKISISLNKIEDYKVEYKDKLNEFRNRFSEFELSADSSKKVCEIINQEMQKERQA